MLATAQPVCLLIADISGYTSYLVGVELDHAQDILADLITTVVSALRPNFKLAKLEGDAAFVFAPADKVDGSMLLDTIERCYFGFRRRRRDVRQATSCECDACLRIPDLNLKFVAHHGRAIRQKVAGREELLGSDVIVVHRLLKNTIVEEMGIKAYAAFSQTCIDAMGIDPEALAMTRRAETYDHVGEVPIWVHDLERRWQEEDSRKRERVDPEHALLEIALPIAAPPQVVWEFLTMPGRRTGWQHGVTDVIEEPQAGGRRGVGTINHCIHGPDAMLQEILDWRPWDYVTDRTTMPGGAPVVLSTFELEPTREGTLLHVRFAPNAPKDKAMLLQVGPMLATSIEAGFKVLSGQAAQEATARTRGKDLEPTLPAPKPGGLFAEIRPLQIIG
jgi:uncharacterized protein YndB with AHSA1/START domain